ncbi:MAG: DNA-binding protein [Candidatus Kaistia colombiensis]|nr:MAG: DNA-binding protein [Kaistia sp.]
MNEPAPRLHLIWGVKAIALLIGRTERQTFRLLSDGLLPAKKVGGRWVIDRSRLTAFFSEDWM